MISLLLRLLKSDIARAVAALVAIPVVMIGGTAMAFSINPESSTIGPFNSETIGCYTTRAACCCGPCRWPLSDCGFSPACL